MTSEGQRPRNAGLARRPATLVAALLILAGALRVISTYSVFSQGYDEPAHLACGMEWLDKGTFQLEPIHPPLPRIAAALGPYLAGLRLPKVEIDRDERGDSYSIYPAGNEILFSRNQYMRNVKLMRSGMLPFFLIASAVMFLWVRRLLGEWPAVVAVFLFTNLPPVLAYAGLAYVDFSLATFLPATLFAFAWWLENPTMKRSTMLGLSAGLAILANFTVFVFLPPCLLVTAAARYWLGKPPAGLTRMNWRTTAVQSGVALLAACLLVWGAYRFSAQRLDKVFDRPAHDVERLQRVPSFVKAAAMKVVAANPVLPAPEVFKGLAGNFNIGKSGYDSYLFGRVRSGGWWYFYLAVLGLKTPLSFLLLAATGAAFSVRSRDDVDWRVVAVTASVAVVLLLSMPIKVNLGIRHILFIYPLLTILAAYGVVELWRLRTRWPRAAVAAVIVLLAWQGIPAARIHPDYIAYTNLLGGRRPEQRIVYGCDFDCGQDVLRLSEAVRARGIQHLSLRVWTSGDLTKMDLPPFDTLVPHRAATGWVAASVLYLKMGESVWDSKDVDAYRWLEAYQPVAYVGKTIRLYYIPAAESPK